MGILDRLFRGKRMDKFEKKHFLSDKEKSDIKTEVRKVYQNILNGHMTRAQGKEYLLKYVTWIVKRRYPGIDFEKSELAGKINRYVSMKIRKLDEPLKHEGYLGEEVEGKRGIHLGRAHRLGKIAKLKQDFRSQMESLIRDRRKRKGLLDPTEEEARYFLDNYFLSKSSKEKLEMNFIKEELGRDLIEEVIKEAYDESGKLRIKRGERIKDGLVKPVKKLERRKEFWKGRPKKPPSDKEFEKMPKVEFVTPSDLKAFLEKVVEEAKKEEGEEK